MFVALICVIVVVGSYRLPGQIFSSVPSARSGITFRNDITESDSLNILADFYMFNGGGAAVGDLDGDGLRDVVFSSTNKGITLYRNAGNLRFEDRTVESGLVVGDTLLNTGVLVADLNGDGLLDVLLSRRYNRNLVFINHGMGTFRRDTTSALAVSMYTTHAVQLDYDRDGDLDVFLVNSGEPRRNGYLNPGKSDMLLRNDGGGTYVDVSASAGILDKGYGLSASVGDFNDDGWPDIFVTNDFEERDKLWMNQRDGSFQDRAAVQLPHMSWASMGSDAADLNDDGMLDVVTLDMLPRDNYRRQTQLGGMSIYGPFFDSLQRIHNCLFLNRGDGAFIDIGHLAGISATDWSWCVLTADYDLDGRMDVYVTNGTKRDLGDQDYAYNLRQRGFKSQLEASVNMPTSRLPNYLFLSDTGLRYRIAGGERDLTDPRISNGAAYADLDDDGDLELLVNNTDDEASLLVNSTNERAGGSGLGWIGFQLYAGSVNPQGIGSRLVVSTNLRTITREMYTSRGFQSTSDDRVVVGLRNGEVVDSVVVLWTTRQRSTYRNLQPGRYHKLDRSTAVLQSQQSLVPARSVLSAVTDSVLPFVHRENIYDDFKRERLLPYRYSKDGPRLAVGDVDADGREDVIVCGAKYQPTQCFFQKSDGTFVSRACGLNDVIESEDLDVALFDVDGDRDLDLYVVTGGAEFSDGDEELADRLYLNDGKGRFTPSSTFISDRHAGSCIIVADIDRDGDQDVFVGGHIVPGKFPSSARSTLYRNERGQLRDVTDEVAPGLANVGMITSAAWVDIDQDADPDLVVVGEWMAPSIWRNTKGRFENITSATIPQNMRGWWSCVRSMDVDGDGDQDLLLGNIGLNCRFVPEPNNPIRCRTADIDENGSLDQIISLTIEGREVPLRGRQLLTQHIPTLTRSYTTFDSFAKASVADLFIDRDTSSMTTMQVDRYESGMLINTGGQFAFSALPEIAQAAPILEMLPYDVDRDGDLDIVITGNTRTADADVIGYDGGMGLVLRNDRNGNFSSLTARESGFVVYGEGRDLAVVRRRGASDLLIATRNSASARLFALPLGK
ncbi:MAG: hypothetical protein RL594_843 [Bacteroidota bacterium]|jgi:hypothetical protein